MWINLACMVKGITNGKTISLILSYLDQIDRQALSELRRLIQCVHESWKQIGSQEKPPSVRVRFVQREAA